MSFGFGVGDFLAVGNLCWKLYQNVYKVSRDAPEELRGIRDELGALSNTIRLLTDDIQDPNSMLKQPGQENRFDLAADIMKNTNNTLQRLQSLAEKHELLHVQATGGSRRHYLKIQWDKLRFAKEWSAITDLRAKLLYHNNQLSLLLQVLNNSSLERLQKEEQRTQRLIEEIHMAIHGASDKSNKTITSPFLNTNSVDELTETFLVNAQYGTRAWATIGVDSWLQAGRWWFIKAQSLLHTALPESPEYSQAFVDMLKSSWILTNIISMHPQRKLILSNDPRDHIIEGLARALKAEHDKLASLSLAEPSLKQLRSADLSIWTPAKITSLMPVRDGGANSSRSAWKALDGDIIFQSFAFQIHPMSANGTECILILEVQSQRRLVTFIAQGIDGQDIFRITLYSEDAGLSKKYELKRLSMTSSYKHDKDHLHDSFALAEKSTGTPRYEAAFRVVDLESRDILSAINSGLHLLSHNFVHPPINFRSLEAAAVLTLSRHRHVPQRFGTMKTPPPQESSTPTDQLCTLATRAMDYLEDDSVVVLPTFPGRSSLSMERKWPYFVWLSPTAEHVTSLAEITDSVWNFAYSKLDCIHAAFAKGCPVFFDKILEFLGGKAQGRLGWSMDNGMNPEGLHSSNFKLVVRAILQSGDYLLLDSFLELADPSFHGVSRYGLSDILMEAFRSVDKPTFKYIIMNPTVTNAISSPKGRNSGIDLLDRLLHEVLKYSPVQTLEWLLDLLPESCLVSTVASAQYPKDWPTHNSVQVFVLGGTPPRHLDLKADWPKEGNELWIIPALFRQDREIFDFLLDRGLGQLHPLRLTMASEDSSWGAFSPEGSSWKEFPPDGMPDLPLYCAIFLAFEPEFILFLCKRGASISDSTRPGQPQPAIIEHLTSLMTVDQARQSFIHANELMSEIFDAKRLRLGEFQWSLWRSESTLPLKIARDIATESNPWFNRIDGLWRRFYAPYYGTSLDCLIAKERPFPLQTQENWNEWRTKVLQILKDHHERSQST